MTIFFGGHEASEAGHTAALSKDDFGRRRLWTGQEHLKRRCLATLPGPLNTVQGVPKNNAGEIGTVACLVVCKKRVKDTFFGWPKEPKGE